MANDNPKQRLLDMPPNNAIVCSDAIEMVQYMEHFISIEVPSVGVVISNKTLRINKRAPYNKIFSVLRCAPWVEGLVLRHPFEEDDFGIDLGTAVPKYTGETSPTNQLKSLCIFPLWSKAVYQLLLDNRDSLERFEGVVWECNWTFPALTHLTINEDCQKIKMDWTTLSPSCFPSLTTINLPRSWLCFCGVNATIGLTYGELRNDAIWRHTEQQKKKLAAIKTTREVLLPFLTRDAISVVVRHVAKIEPSAWNITIDEIPQLLYTPPSHFGNGNLSDWKPLVDATLFKEAKKTSKQLVQLKRRFTKATREREGDTNEKKDLKLKKLKKEYEKQTDKMVWLIKEHFI
jgi:hypothetical protein